jgi:hypothetical protein
LFRQGGDKSTPTLRVKILEDDAPAPGSLPISSSQPVVIAIAALNRQLLDFLQKSAFANPLPKTEEAAAEERPLPRRENDPAVNSQDRAMKPPAPPEERDRNVLSRDTLARLGLRENVSAPTQPESQEINADAAGQRASREVLDSVNVGPELAALHLLLHPPKKLNPYLRWLLYTRAVRDENIHAYVQVREKMREIYKRAQAGEGEIRYRNKTGITIEPLATDMGGSYALVARRHRTADTDNVQS